MSSLFVYSVKCAKIKFLTSDGFLTSIIIHSKYLSVSDWLKSNGKFFVTTSVGQIWKTFAIKWKTTSMVQHSVSIGSNPTDNWS